MKFTLEIDCDNDAFKDGNVEAELYRVLQSVSRRIMSCGVTTTNTDVFDYNGNKVGQFAYGSK